MFPIPTSLKSLYNSPMTKSLEVHYEFALMGEVLEPIEGKVAVDVGSKCGPGVIDHHFARGSEDCAASLVATRFQELVLDHLSGWNGPLSIIMHREPDLDCVVSAYLVRALVEQGTLPQGGEALAQYALVVDSGLPPPDGIGDSSLWALFTASCHLLQQRSKPDADDEERFVPWVKRGFELLDLVMAHPPSDLAQVRLDRIPSGWQEEQAFLTHQLKDYIEEKRRIEASDDTSANSFSISVPRMDGGNQTVRGLLIENPICAMFKHLARADGFIFTHVCYSSEVPSPGSWRHVISVTPEQGLWLKGLGRALENRELEARAKVNQKRDGPPRWEDVTNADPWYDGRSPLHEYTIVDTPRAGTLIPKDEVERIVRNTDSWIPLGQALDRRVCGKGCKVASSAEAIFCPMHGFQLVPEVVKGRYQVVELIGEGGMGIVFKVSDRLTGQPYAMKVLRKDLWDRQDSWRRFIQEARLANRVGHDNIVRHVDFGADATTGLYIMSELVRGTSLSDDIDAWWVQQGKPYPFPRMKHVLLQMCDALCAIHAQGVLHRDLKPSNIMLVSRGPNTPADDPLVKLMDFGISILLNPDEWSSITTTGAFVGSLQYASPEHLRDQPLDVRSDLYSLGAIFHKMLCGRAPFGHLKDSILVKLHQPVPPFVESFPDLDIPADAEHLVLTLLQPLPERRPASVEVVRAMVEQLAW